jgi:putative flippase GtrA
MERIKKSDVIAALIAGELIAIFAWITVSTSQMERLEIFRWIIFLVMPILAVLGLFVAEIVARWWGSFWQISKFLLVGILNTFVDLGVFNSLKAGFGIFEAGFLLAGFKAVSFVAAVINSFFWNKFWVFERKGRGDIGKQFGVFFIISTVGIILNTGVFYLLTALIGAPKGISTALWHNISVILAGLAVFTWNFLGYKLIVFRSSEPPKNLTE